jgi:hypothetical protein
MKKLLRILIGVFAAVGAAYIALLLFVSFGIKPEKSCMVYPVMSIAAPDGKFSAEQRQETCNYEKQTITTVQLIKNDTFSLGGSKQWSVLRAPSAQVVSKEPPTYEPLRLQLAWLSNTELQISYPHGTIVTRSEGDFDGITVQYREVTLNGR